jgi:hypothetical protein
VGVNLNPPANPQPPGGCFGKYPPGEGHPPRGVYGEAAGRRSGSVPVRPWVRAGLRAARLLEAVLGRVGTCGGSGVDRIEMDFRLGWVVRRVRLADRIEMKWTEQ